MNDLLNVAASVESVDVEANSELRLGIFHEWHNQIEISEIAGTRISRCIYQVNKKTGKKVRESAYVRIPVAHLGSDVITERLVDLMPYVIAWLQESEDKMIKQDHAKGLESVYCDGLSIDKIISFLEASGSGSRLNKELIEKWFVDVVESVVIMMASEKLGVSEDSEDSLLEKLAMVVEAYKSKFASLASPKVQMKPDDCEALIRVIRRCEQSDLGDRFVGKLEVLAVKEAEVLLSL